MLSGAAFSDPKAVSLKEGLGLVLTVLFAGLSTIGALEVLEQLGVPLNVLEWAHIVIMPPLVVGGMMIVLRLFPQK